MSFIGGCHLCVFCFCETWVNQQAPPLLPPRPPPFHLLSTENDITVDPWASVYPCIDRPISWCNFFHYLMAKIATRLPACMRYRSGSGDIWEPGEKRKKKASQNESHTAGRCESPAKSILGCFASHRSIRTETWTLAGSRISRARLKDDVRA